MKKDKEILNELTFLQRLKVSIIWSIQRRIEYYGYLVMEGDQKVAYEKAKGLSKKEIL